MGRNTHIQIVREMHVHTEEMEKKKKENQHVNEPAVEEQDGTTEEEYKTQ